MNRLSQDLINLLEEGDFPAEISRAYGERVAAGKLTIQENPESHFCVYSVAYDPEVKQLFIGHHKKAGKWLFSGGHIDGKETIREALDREIGEEWGLDVFEFEINTPALLTITEINNLAKQTCRQHYDIWHFISVSKDSFCPKAENLAKEFYEIGWKSVDEAKSLVKDKSTSMGIDFIVDNYF